MTVSLKSTEFSVLNDAGAGDGLVAGVFAGAALTATGAAAGAGVADSGFMALLEMTNLRRTGGVLTFGAFGEPARWLRGADLGAVTLRFDINYQTKKHRAGSEKTMAERKNTTSDETPAFVAVTLELRIPED